MLVIENPNGKPNAGERAFVAHQRSKNGIALVNFMVGGGGPRKPGREVDVILILPRGIFSVEVKYTSAVGELDSPANDVWSVGDIANPFSSRNKSPAAQADQATKILAHSLAEGPWPKDFITPVVAIHGPVTIPGHVRWVGTVAVATVEHFDLIEKEVRGRAIRAEHIGPMLQRLGVAKANLPSMERLIEEGFDVRPPQPTPVRQSPPAPAGPSTVTLAPARSLLSRPEPEWMLGWRGIALWLAALALGGWQLASGSVLARLQRPRPGEHYFVYGDWATRSGLPGSDGQGVLLILATAVFTAIGLVIRRKTGAMLHWEAYVFLAAVAVGLASAPLLLAPTGWFGLALVALGYVIVWPLVSMLVRDLAAPLRQYLGHLRKEYQW